MKNNTIQGLTVKELKMVVAFDEFVSVSNMLKADLVELVEGTTREMLAEQVANFNSALDFSNELERQAQEYSAKQAKQEEMSDLEVECFIENCFKEEVPAEETRKVLVVAYRENGKTIVEGKLSFGKATDKVAKVQMLKDFFNTEDTSYYGKKILNKESFMFRGKRCFGTYRQETIKNITNAQLSANLNKAFNEDYKQSIANLPSKAMIKKFHMERRLAQSNKYAMQKANNLGDVQFGNQYFENLMTKTSFTNERTLDCIKYTSTELIEFKTFDKTVAYAIGFIKDFKLDAQGKTVQDGEVLAVTPEGTLLSADELFEMRDGGVDTVENDAHGYKNNGIQLGVYNINY